MNAMPILPKQIPCVCIMYYYMANKDDSDSDSCLIINFGEKILKLSSRYRTTITVVQVQQDADPLFVQQG